MRKMLIGAATALGVLCALPASAATVLVNFSGTFANDGTAANDHGDFTATATLDVENGIANSGSGTFTFHNMTHVITLVTVNTPDNHTDFAPDYPVGLKSNGGDNVFGADQIFPLTSPGGLLFATDTTMPADFSSALINFFSNNGTLVSSIYGTPTNDVRLYSQTGTLTYTYAAVTPSVPEPTSWAMMIFGLGVVGYALRRVSFISNAPSDAKARRIASNELIG